MKSRTVFITTLLMAALLSSWAGAQVFYAAPPTGFDPVKASDDELDQYGLPPRPDASETVAYNAWKRLVTSPQTRLENPAVEVTNIVNGPAQNWQIQGTVKGNLTATTSDNWSGVAITAPSGTFTKNKSAVYMQGVMPAMGVDNCSYGPYAMSWWIGFDGAGNGDVLQAGSNSTTCSTSYVVWYEWFEAGCTSSSGSYPCYQTNLSLAVSPGDYLAMEVWYTTASPKGHAYILNYTTGKSVSVGFNEPSGTATYEGSSVEWITERPGYSSGLANLANYLGQPSDAAYAYNGSSIFYPGKTPSGTTAYSITMTCPPWNPSSACPKKNTALSLTEVSGTSNIWTFVDGPAYQ
jgi:hypothetical protein